MPRVLAARVGVAALIAASLAYVSSTQSGCACGRAAPVAEAKRPPSDPRIDDGSHHEAPAPPVGGAAVGSAAHDAGIAAAGAAPADAGLVLDDQARFAEALTGHRRKVYTDDLDGIRSRGVLRVLTRNNSTSYFLYKGVEAGFDYELARLFADELGVRLEMVVAPTRRDLIPWLLDGRGDIILAALSTESARKDRVAFTRPYLTNRWVVVTRKGKHVPASITELTGLDVLVRPSSGALTRLRALSGAGFQIAAAPETLESEDLLDEVAAKRAGACVIEDRIAQLELMHRDDLRVAFPLERDDDAAWAVRRDNPKLLAAADDFVARHRKDTTWNLLFLKYHRNKDQTAAVRNDELRADREGNISPWDRAFQKAGADHDVDWRLLAAQAYQESRFDPQARSHMGALGLMQLLPTTAKELDCADPKDPEQAIRASARFIGKLIARYASEEVALKDRVRFALAAYNAGPGHLTDARRLATHLGLDPNRWFGNVENALLMLSKPRYYQAAAHGFARGEESVRYVSEIQTRYDAYVSLTSKRAGQKNTASPGSTGTRQTRRTR